MPTSGKRKDELQADLTTTLKGAQRVPTLLTQKQSQSLADLNLNKYEVLDCEPLHDMKGHLLNLLPEIPFILPSNLKEECQLILETTLPKGMVCGALLRTAAIKPYLKLRTYRGINQQIIDLLGKISHSVPHSQHYNVLLRCFKCITVCGYTTNYAPPSFQTLANKLSITYSVCTSMTWLYMHHFNMKQCAYDPPMLKVRKGYSIKLNILVFEQQAINRKMFCLPYCRAYRLEGIRGIHSTGADPGFIRGGS